MEALLTGFEGWAGRLNPTGKIANEIDGKSIDGMKIIGRELPEDFYRLPTTLRDLIRQFEPDVIVGIGWDYISKIKVEKIGVNVRNSTFGEEIVPDNYGNKPLGEEIVPGGATAIRATFPAEQIVVDLNKAGIPAYVSYNAGTHCCNTVMYSALHHLRSAGLQGSIAGFIHVPPTPEMGVKKTGITPMDYNMEREAIQKALETCAVYLKSQKHRGL